MKHTLIILLLAMAGVSQAKFTTHVTLTCYHATKGQCDSTPNITADGTRIDHKAVRSGKQRLVAVSRDLLPYLPYGTEVEIEGYGRYTVADTMAERWEHRMDILQHPSKPVFKADRVKVTIVSKAPDKMPSVPSSKK